MANASRFSRSPSGGSRSSVLLLGLFLLCVCGVVGSLVNRNTNSPNDPTNLNNPIKPQSSQNGTPRTSQLELGLSDATPSLLLPTATLDPIVQAAGSLPYTGAYYYSAETSHSISVFASLFNSMGAVQGFGYPLTEPFIEHGGDGQWRWVQYFEKAETEYHPDLPGANQYQLASLGAVRLHEKYPNGTPVPKALPKSKNTASKTNNSYQFPQTGFIVRDPFLKRWHEGGEVRRFGYPISPSFEEQSDADGKTYVVQYFERAVFEYHPNEKPPYDVQLTALGSQELAHLYPTGAPSNASAAIPSPTVNAQATADAHTKAVATQEAVQAQATAATASAAQTATAKSSNPGGTGSGGSTSNSTGSGSTPPGQFIPYPGNGGGPTQCADGTLSHSSGRGTCSHHGGIR